MAREIEIAGTRYPVELRHVTGHTTTAYATIGRTEYHGAAVGFGMDGAAVASLIAQIEYATGMIAEDV